MSRNPMAILLQRRTTGPALHLVALITISMVSYMSMATEGRIQAAWADALSVPQLGKLPEGEITAVESTTLDVAGRSYALHQKLTIVNDEGKPMELKQLRPGLIIQYHVKEGALDKIIVLMQR